MDKPNEPEISESIDNVVENNTDNEAVTEAVGSEEDNCGKAVTPDDNSAEVRGQFNRIKVWGIYSGYLLLFLAAFALMLALLVIAAVGIPAGAMLGIFGIAVMIFKADFIITELAPQLMLFGGLAVAFASAFCGLIAVKTGFVISRLFLRIKRRCDRLRGW